MYSILKGLPSIWGGLFVNKDGIINKVQYGKATIF